MSRPDSAKTMAKMPKQPDRVDDPFRIEEAACREHPYEATWRLTPGTQAHLRCRSSTALSRWTGLRRHPSMNDSALQHVDIAVLGGGLGGLIAALAAHRHSPPGTTINARHRYRPGGRARCDDA